MATAIPEVLISQVLDKVDAKFQMLHSHIWGPASHWSCRQHCGVNFTISGLAAAILDSWMALELIGLHDFVAQPYSGKVTKSFHSTPSGSETTAKKPAWG